MVRNLPRQVVSADGSRRVEVEVFDSTEDHVAVLQQARVVVVMIMIIVIIITTITIIMIIHCVAPRTTWPFSSRQ